MKIGELASATGTPVETLRFYEREGLLPEPARTDGNFRIYFSAHAERRSFIRHCRTLDMALEELRVVLTFKDAPLLARPDGLLSSGFVLVRGGGARAA